MIVVADASPLHYLVLIGSADVLKPLCECVIVPHAVAGELQHASAPDLVRAWIAHPPNWCGVRPNPPSDPSLEFLGPGERSAIALALSLHADRVLIDEWEGRVEAERRYLRVTGTLGVVVEAHQHHLLDFDEAVARLSQTTFYMSAELINSVRRQLFHDRGTP